jgi:preprotein translocase subunit SecE
MERRENRMGRIGEKVEGTKQFFTGVIVELKKCAWPTRPELLQSTLVVLVSVLIVGVYVGFSDWVVMNVLQMVVRR